MDQPAQFTLPEFPVIINRRIDAASSLGYVAQVVVLSLFRELLSQRQAVVENQSIEGVHKIRVAARRIRTAMQTFGPVWDEGKAQYFSKRFACFAEQFGAARDLDVLRVYLSGGSEIAQAEPPKHCPALESHLAGLRQAEQAKLDKAVLQLEQAGFVDEVVAYFSTHPFDLHKLDGAG